MIEKGIPCLRITDEAPWQTLKTASSRRLIPLHPRLLSLGFLAFVEGKRGQERLFAELQPDAFGYLSDAFSKHFARFLKSVEVKRPKVSFHSFRHCFEDACRAAGVERGLMDALQGHSEGGMAARYGQGFPVERLAEAVRSIDYPEVTLWRGGERF
ncbi:hypothetical protein [Paroceanicella profunda]|uniref:hypothetical protein n=1 Tax=Paroceanicella profunda TaxID=2579971 RepID=UPI001EEF7A02|nr:hypothetical protein [Paroceanicella profunda]